SDIAMDKIDGFELCLQIKQRHPEIPVLLLTGHVDAKTRTRAAQVGADACVLKGTGLASLDMLTDRIHKHVALGRAKRAQPSNRAKIPPAIAVHDPETGERIGASRGYLRLVGEGRDPATGGATVAQGDGIDAYVREAIKDGVGSAIREFVWTHQRDDGEEIQTEASLERIRIDDVDRVVVTLRPADGQNHREATIQAIYHIVADRSRTFEEKVEDLMTLGRTVLGTGFATLSRMRGDEYVFEHVQSPRGEIQPGDVVSLRETLCEQAVLNHKTLVVDSPLEAEALNREATLQLSCYVGAPVYVGEQVHGTFCFYDIETRKERFTDWEVTLVEMMSQWLSLEMERDQVRTELERENQRLDQLASMMSHD
ncbi:MAG: response regulator, partial [Candidatus Thermoplasmatota archaeon]|nr:response regulator [Candidatus Thermoplasmatota archaeon]